MSIKYTENEIKKYLKQNLPPGKYRHTLGVTAMSLDLAKRYGVDLKKAVLAGLLHDAGKDLNRSKKYFKYIKLDPFEKKIRPLWHNKLGAVIAVKVFGVKDKAVLSAIRKHSTADNNMSALDKIIYIADSAEKNRKFKGVDGIRRAAKKDLTLGFVAALAKKINYVLEGGKTIHPKSISAWNRYIR